MKKIFLFVILAVVISSCESQKHLYSWYDSEQATYRYVKERTDESLEKAMAQYKKVIEKQNGDRKVVPPGVNAEYGFILYKAGMKEQGLVLLNAEIQAYPESERFISQIIKQLEK